jgi:hypothetical protein
MRLVGVVLSRTGAAKALVAGDRFDYGTTSERIWDEF